MSGYQSGQIIRSCYPDVSTINHAVLITGWGYDSVSGLPYFEYVSQSTTCPPVLCPLTDTPLSRYKNSWSSSWGSDGYFNLVASAQCGFGQPFDLYVLLSAT